MDASNSTLYAILRDQLHSGAFDHRPLNDLIESVRDEFLRTGPRHVLPNPMTDDFLSGLETEIKDMVRSLTYGHFNVKEYNLKRKKS